MEGLVRAMDLIAQKLARLRTQLAIETYVATVFSCDCQKTTIKGHNGL